MFQSIQHPVTGVNLTSRKMLRPLAMGWKRYKDCFSGTDGVSWLVSNMRESRSAALARLQAWLDAGLVSRVGGPGPFEDDRNTYYQFQGRDVASGSSAAAKTKAFSGISSLVVQSSVVAAAAVSVSRGKKKARPGHVLALCGSGLQMSLQLAKAGDSGARRVTNVWPLRAVVSIDVDPGVPKFVVRLRREEGSALEYRFQADSVLARDGLVGAVLRAASEQMRYAIKSNFDWEKRVKEPEAPSAVSLETLESASRSEEDSLCQQLLWEVMEAKHLSAVAAGEAKERELEELQRENARALMELGDRLDLIYNQIDKMAQSALGVERSLVAQGPLVKQGEENIRAIRGHEAQRERSQRHMNDLVQVLQELMSSLSVPPRFLSLMREPKFNSDDPADMVLAIKALDKVVTLKNLDQRLLKMRAVSDRAQEYRALIAHFSEALGSHVNAVLTDRAALRPPQASTTSPQPFYQHITPFIKLFEALPRTVTAQLLDSYMDLAKQVYKSDLPAYFGGLLNAVRRSKELTILEAFHLALQAVWGLVQAELEFWTKLLETAVTSDDHVALGASVNQQLVNRLGEVFAEQGEELGALVE